MNRIPAIVFSLITVLVITLAVVLAFQNSATQVPLQLGVVVLPAVSVGSVLLGGFFMGGIAMFLRMWQVNLRVSKQIKQFELRRDKAELKAESTTDQVKVLENKIKTLENALAKALSSSQNG